MNEQQQRSRRKNLKIHVLPNGILDENLETTCLELLNKIVDKEITSAEIDACHRLPIKNNRPKPVIMSFVNRKRCDELMDIGPQINESNLTRFGIAENHKIYINHNLSSKMKFLSYLCICFKVF